MTVPVRIKPISSVWGGNADHRDDPPQTTSPPTPALDPDLIRRFHALIEEVTDALMQHRNQDRRACRSDAIALLIATSEQVDPPSEGGESPLLYLLLEEQQKAAAALGSAPAADAVPAFLRA